MKQAPEPSSAELSESAAKPGTSMLSRFGALFKKGLSGLGNRSIIAMEILLGLMILLVVVDVTLRRLFDHPLSFSYELMGFGLVIVVWSSILYSTMRDRHISVDIITSHFPVKARRVLNAVADFISMILLFAIGWRSIIYGFQLRESGQISVMLDLPFYPFIFLIAFGAICAGFMLLVSFIESIKSVKSAVKK